MDILNPPSEQDLIDTFAETFQITGTEETPEGGLEVTLGQIDEINPFSELETAEIKDHSANLADFLDEEELSKIVNRISDRYSNDRESSREFHECIEKGIKRLGLTIEVLDKPFPGATPITHPLILETAVKTQAKLMGEVFSGNGLVDTFVHGDKTAEVSDKCARVKRFMDYQYLHHMKEFIPETDRLTFRYALTGNAFRKYYFDPILARPKTRYITEDKFIATWDATLIEDLDFHTEILPPYDMHEVEDMIATGLIREGLDIEKLKGTNLELSQIDERVNSTTGESFAIIPNAPGDESSDLQCKFQFLETHCYLKLPEPFNDGEARLLPYVVIWDPEAMEILSIRRNWVATDPRKLKRNWYSHYKFVPGLGFYAYGLIHLLQNFQFSLTQMLRSLLDAGQLANLKGGFVQKGALRFQKNQQITIGMGEWKEVDTGTRTMRDAFMPLEYSEPSQVIERLIMFLDKRGQQFADSTESVIADSTNYGPVGTTIALLEASTKFMTGIQKRFYQTLQDEFQILFGLNKEIVDSGTVVFHKGTRIEINPEDFSDEVTIAPQADPNMASSSHRIALAQTKLQAAQQSPDLHNLREAYIHFYRAIGMDEAEINTLLLPEDPGQDQPTPNDPITDLLTLKEGKPIKAFPGQDHDAHIKFKEAFLEDPLGGLDPNLQEITYLIKANIQEHKLLRYLNSVQGVVADVGLDPASEFALAQAAETAKQLNEIAVKAEIPESPQDLIAQATALDAETRARMADHRIERDTADLSLRNIDQQIKLMELSMKENLEQSKLQASQIQQLVQENLNFKKMLVEKSLLDLATPNKTE